MDHRRLRIACAAIGLLVMGCFCAAWAEPKPADPQSSKPADPAQAKPAEAVPAKAPAAAAPETPKDVPTAEELAGLVRELGNPSYETRARASARLTQLGLKAQTVLTAALKDGDPEVRRRCRWIMAEVLEADNRRRLDAFLADTEGKQEHDLPCWLRYRRVIGADKTAREVFVQMQRAEEGLMASAALGSPTAAESLKARFQQVWRMMSTPDPTGRVTPSLGTIAALMFVASNTEIDLPQEVIDSPYLQNVVHQQEFQKALQDNALKPVARKILGQWILRPGNLGMVINKLQLAIQFQVPEGLYPAVRTIGQDKNKVPGHVRIFGISALGFLGGKPHAARLVPLLDDETECQRHMVNNVTFVIQTRDVALAWLVHLTGQKHADYGMENAKAEFDRIKQHNQYWVNYGTFGFREPAKRDEALKRWKTWAASNPLAKPPDVPGPDPDPEARKPAEGEAAAPGGIVAGQVRIGPFGIVRGGTKPEDERPHGLSLAMADRLQVRNLSMAWELSKQGRYVEAARLLGDILAARSDFSFQPDGSVPLYRCLKPEAERIIGQLPEEGRQVYRLQFESQARNLLGEAVRAASPEQLAAIAERYFHTPAGAEATYLLGLYHLDHGEPFRAALYLDRLRGRSTEADRFEPMLSLALATCWSRAGMPTAAEAVLRALRARHPRATIEVGGQPREPFAEPGQALAWLESLVGPSPKLQSAEGWLLFRGGPARNAPAAVGTPFVRADVLAPISADPAVRGGAETLRKEFHKQYRSVLPRLHPLVVGQSIIFRTATELRAVDFASGRLLWEAPLEDALRTFLQRADDRQKQEQSDYFSRGLRRRFWDDSAFGMLSSDGRMVFGVEDLSFGFRPDYQRLVVMPDGRRRLDPAVEKNYNLLVAYDVQTGKVCWEIGGPPEPNPAQQEETFFLGPPLPLGGRLYAVADVKEETRLLELDASSGRLLSFLTLAAREKNPQSRQFMFMPWGLPEIVPARSASSPSYADGVLVCRTSDDQFVGVNLTTRSVQWIYEAAQQEEESQTGMINVFGNPWMRRAIEAMAAERDGRWADASVTIAEGRILLTPPESGRLICLDLADGHLHWSIPRRDGLYVACVYDGRVLVVGRGSVWAVNLSDGTPAWPQSPLELPAGALASGRGFLSGDHYYLPLTTAEVAAIGLRHGRLDSRSRSPDGTIPGNLVACHGAILSQDVDGLRRFATLAERQQQSTAALTQKPDDPQALADQGEVLLCQGRLVEAIDLLHRSIKLKPDDRTRRLLSDALEDGLRADFATFRDLAVQLDAVIDRPDVRGRFLRHLAEAQQQAGQIEVAFQTYLKLIDLEPNQEEMDHAAATRVVRRDRWIAARLTELWSAAPPPLRAELDRQIALRVRDDRLPEFLRYFGAHPTAQDARLRLARQLAERREWSQAEGLLWQVLRSGVKEQHQAAVARLAVLCREAGRTDDAAALYRHLRGPLAEAVCADGKTGRQLVEALPAGDAVRKAMDPAVPWPAGQVRVEEVNNSNGFPTRYPLTLAGSSGPLDVPARLEIDGGGQMLLAFDPHGRKLWEASPQQRPSRWGYNGTMFSYAQGALRGHTLTVWLGNRVAAVEWLGGQARILWTQDTVVSDPPYPGVAMFMPRRMQMWRQPRFSFATEPQSLAVTGHCVCFQQEHKLLAVAPQSGQVLWSRNDTEQNSDLFGDDEMIFVTSSDSNEAAVYNAVDGREIGRRQVPELKKRMAILGRRIVTWESGQRCRLAMVDAWTGKTAWQQEFEPKAQPWMIEDDEVAVLDTQGRLAVIAVPSGEVVMRSGLDAQPALDGLVVLRASDRYVVLAHRPSQQAAGPIMFQIAPANVPINGQVYGLQRPGGKRLWTADVADHSLRLGQSPDLPILMFHNIEQKQTNNQYKVYEHTLCLDTRTGRTLHRKDVEGSSGNQFDVQADPANARIEVRTGRGTIKLTFTSEPVKDK
jgi:outer membrane protein assembly factor BamB/tetratricopeptide (TPR) repeat protein